MGVRATEFALFRVQVGSDCAVVSAIDLSAVRRTLRLCSAVLLLLYVVA